LVNKSDYSGALLELNQALDLDPLFWEAYKLKGEIYLKQNKKEEALAVYRELAQNLKTSYLTFQCVNCGFQPIDLQWRCPQCRSWDTIHLTDNPSPETYWSSAIHEDAEQKKGTEA
jgi:lipopolysaccharide biosynthesis regulator YciM